MFSCFNFSAYVRFFVNVLIEMNVNISNELNFSEVYRSIFGVHSLCTQPNVVYTSINLRKMKSISKYLWSLISASFVTCLDGIDTEVAVCTILSFLHASEAEQNGCTTPMLGFVMTWLFCVQFKRSFM